MENMNSTPMANRFTIGLFGRRNVGKSSLINALTQQSIAVTSDIAGTTTDPVYKAMELLPLGPIVFIDTAGLDDTGELGRLRIEKTYEVLRKCNLAILVSDTDSGLSRFEAEFLEQLKQRKIPCVFVINKCDAGKPDNGLLDRWQRDAGVPTVCASSLLGSGLEELKAAVIAQAHIDDAEPALVGDLIKAGDFVVLVTPIDKSAPKGRLILPQQQTIRDILEHDAMAIVAKEYQLKQTLDRMGTPPALVITDSQAFSRVAADTPPAIPLTSFSILFARQKADLAEMVRGVKRINRLKPGEKVLIVEGCTHHLQSDDIGRVKIPRWIRQTAGDNIHFDWASGACYPQDISDYAVIIHCGGCMLNRREMQYRVAKAREQGVCITNYGVLIAQVMGILPRALQIFPAAASIWDNPY
ncbi:MAG: [FeFe] hydrogenase H-cluster maturation GTPase HydF [Clostridiaceae bacterium]|nr:[FeFe] hydrogenase H-cluster maturation GTPase HydF [Clostridiaceae bacterium]